MTASKGIPIRANGEDGKDGRDGEDGADGEDGQDGRPGSTGPQGKPGADGENAPTPQIKLGSSLETSSTIGNNETIDPNAWYLSVDNGATGNRVSGKGGEDVSTGAEGDSLFTNTRVVECDNAKDEFYI